MLEKKKTLEYIRIDDIKQYERNTRTHSPAQIEQLSRAITEFGFTNPVLIDEKNELIAGHGRCAAARLLGLLEVPAIRLAGLTQAQKKALRIADNQLALNAGWDDEMLGRELAAIEAEGFDLALTGFDLDEIEALLDLATTPEATPIESDEEVDYDDISNSDDDEILGLQEPPEKPMTRLGDVWKLGEHRLLCGSSTSEADVAKLLDGVESADLLFTSPPYADLREYNGNKDLDVAHISQFIRCYAPYVDYQCVNLGLKFKNREVVPYWDDYIDVAHEAGLKLMAWCVWDKGQCGSIGQQKNFIPTRHEWIFIFGREAKKLNKTVAKKEDSINNKRVRKVRQPDGHMEVSSNGDTSCEFKPMESVTRIYSEKGPIRLEHPAVFPVALPAEYIKALTEPGGVIVEPFGGSGTTLIAAERLGRVCYAMELDPGYCDVIVRRWEKTTGLKATREGEDDVVDID